MREQEMFEMDDLQKLELLHQNMKLKLELQNCQNALLKSNQKVMIEEMENIKVERKLKTEAGNVGKSKVTFYVCLFTFVI